MNDDIVNFPTAKPDRIEEMKGPRPAGFQVIVEGRAIPGLSMLDEGGTVHLILDGRFGIDIPRELAPQVAWLVANAMAIGAGYAFLGSESKEQPFAPRVTMLASAPVQP